LLSVATLLIRFRIVSASLMFDENQIVRVGVSLSLPSLGCCQVKRSESKEKEKGGRCARAKGGKNRERCANNNSSLLPLLCFVIKIHGIQMQSSISQDSRPSNFVRPLPPTRPAWKLIDSPFFRGPLVTDNFARAQENVSNVSSGALLIGSCCQTCAVAVAAASQHRI
jgi:hypothetical protein